MIRYNHHSQFDPNRIDVRLQHFRLGQILNMIHDHKIDLFLDERPPLIKRSWSRKQESLFIESLLLKLPTQIFYFDGNDVPWKVIDGFHRLSVIYEFVNNAFRLEYLEYLSDQCSNRYFKDLPGYLQARFLETEIVSYVINPGTPPHIRYNIFHRINETGERLSNQDIRCLFFNRRSVSFIIRLSELPLFVELSANRVFHGKLEDLEYATHFVAFNSCYDSNMKSVEEALIRAMTFLEDISDSKYQRIEKQFEETLYRAIRLFDEYLFRKPQKSVLYIKWSKMWNKDIYDMCMCCLAELNDHDFQNLLSKKVRFLEEFIEIYSNSSSKIGFPYFSTFRNLLSKYAFQ